MTTPTATNANAPESRWHVVSLGEVVGSYATGEEAHTEARTLREGYGCEARVVYIPAR